MRRWMCGGCGRENLGKQAACLACGHAMPVERPTPPPPSRPKVRSAEEMFALFGEAGLTMPREIDPAARADTVDDTLRTAREIFADPARPPRPSQAPRSTPPPPRPQPRPPAATTATAAATATPSPASARRSRVPLALLALLAVVLATGAGGWAYLNATGGARARDLVAAASWEEVVAWVDLLEWARATRDPSVFASRGQAHAMLGRDDEAFDDFERVERSVPGSAARLAWLVGSELDRLGDPAAAMRFYDRSIERDPSEARPFVDRGRAWVALGDPARALADFDEALRIDPGDGQAAEGHRSAEALLPREEAAPVGGAFVGPGGERPTFMLGMPPEGVADVYLQVGDEAADDGDWEVAEASYREALRYHPENPSIHAALAGALLRLGRRDEAVAAATEARRLGHPGDHWVFAELGM